MLADALDKKCDTIFTCGGIQSNHCRSTAVAARQLGLDCYLFLRSPKQAGIWFTLNFLRKNWCRRFYAAWVIIKDLHVTPKYKLWLIRQRVAPMWSITNDNSTNTQQHGISELFLFPHSQQDEKTSFYISLPSSKPTNFVFLFAKDGICL